MELDRAPNRTQDGEKIVRRHPKFHGYKNSCRKLTEISAAGLTIIFSYNTPIVIITDQASWKSPIRFSQTTGRHKNLFDGEQVDYFNALLDSYIEQYWGL